MDTALKLYKTLFIKGINVNTANPTSHGEINKIPFNVFLLFVFLYFVFLYVSDFDVFTFGFIAIFSPILCPIIYQLQNSPEQGYVCLAPSHTHYSNN